MTTRTEILHPPAPPGPAAWLRANLFSTWYNSLLTVVSIGLILWAVLRTGAWLFFESNWAPVINHPVLYMVGQYPRQQLWRVGIALLVISFLLGAGWRVWGSLMRTFAFVQALLLLILIAWPAQAEGLTLEMRGFMGLNLIAIGLGFWVGGLSFIRSRTLLIAWCLSLLLIIPLLHGFSGTPWLPVVPTNLWGGLLVTFILAIGGIVLSFPIGVLLALGRRSTLPVLRLFCIALIEIVRGVPLIGLLFLSSVILPLFLPPDMRIDRLLRALAGLTLFSSAYMAENVRGGLAAVPPGQVEAAKALGLNGIQVTLLIVLPQALRAVIPPIVGHFISLFKDTTLASGVAVVEFLSIGRSILGANPEYVGQQMEVLLFIAAVFWVFSYLMSYASLRLEAALGVGER